MMHVIRFKNNKIVGTHENVKDLEKMSFDKSEVIETFEDVETFESRILDFTEE